MCPLLVPCEKGIINRMKHYAIRIKTINDFQGEEKHQVNAFKAFHCLIFLVALIKNTDCVNVIPLLVDQFKNTQKIKSDT